MKANIQRWLAQAKRRIQHRLRPIRWKEQSKPMFAAQNIQDEVRWFFWISNDGKKPAAQIVLEANGRCNQENLIAQLKSGCKALAMPVDNLTSNWAYMVMGSLAWTLKGWSALLLPEKGRWAEKHRQEKERLLRMEYATFVHAVMQVPCQIVRTARRIVYRFLSWNPWQSALLRLVKQLRCPLRC